MYFRTDLAKCIVQKLASVLAPGGILLLGHAEQDLARGVRELQLADCGDSFVLLRAGAAAHRPTRAPPSGEAAAEEPRIDRTAEPAPLGVAERYASTGRYPQAIAQLDLLLDSDPMAVTALLLRARAKRELGELEAALADLDRCVYLEPLLVLAHIEAL